MCLSHSFILCYSTLKLLSYVCTHSIHKGSVKCMICASSVLYVVRPSCSTVYLSAPSACYSGHLMLPLALYPAQGTTIKPLVRLIHLRLASTRKETLNESVHSAVSALTFMMSTACLHTQLCTLCFVFRV